MNRSILLAAAIVTGVIAFALNFYWLQSSKSSSVSYLRLSPESSLSRGSQFDLNSLGSSEELPGEFVSLADFAMQDTAENRRFLEGQPVISRDIRGGDLILYQHFYESSVDQLSEVIPPGMRAVTIPVSAPGAVGYFVEPGSNVDVIATFLVTASSGTGDSSPDSPGPDPFSALVDNINTRKISQTVMQNVQVLAVGNTLSGRVQSGSYQTVTLLASLEDSEKLVFAVSESESLTLVLRNPGDKETVELSNFEWRPGVSE